MSQNITKFVRCFYFKMTTCFGPCSGPSSGHKSIHSRKLYSISHKIYQSKIQRDLFFVQYSNAVHDLCFSFRQILITVKYKINF